jgi:hypothetical protein
MFARRYMYLHAHVLIWLPTACSIVRPIWIRGFLSSCDGCQAVASRQCRLWRLSGCGRDLWHSDLVDDQNPVPCPTAPPLLVPSERSARQLPHSRSFGHERLPAVEAAGSKGAVGARQEWNLVSPEPASGSLHYRHFSAPAVKTIFTCTLGKQHALPQRYGCVESREALQCPHGLGP